MRHPLRLCLLPILAVAALAVIPGCSDPSGPDARTMTLDIASQRLPCMGVFASECFQVRIRPDSQWTIFHASIEGFVFEPGYEYTLLVERRELNSPPQDSSRFTYRLIAVLRRERVDQLR